MIMRYKLYDTEDKKLYIGVESHYFKLTDAKDSYRESKTQDGKTDDSILFEIAREGEEGIQGTFTFGVEDGEKFALALLNLCYKIKGF
ncbi:hypothetical protein [Niallia circulans]|uniref:Uncharacterized protein n=1 Tax=Niallia circulans TaxID=1397 RepID=A0A941JPL3_NIACI|nr:hypothetical protein [Niallia circulans]MCB5235886.1 hypothetical protein [Niallia circulans]